MNRLGQKNSEIDAERLLALILSAMNNVALGGEDNVASGDRSAVLGGFDNQIGSAPNAAIVGGFAGRIGAGANHAIILGGVDCIVDGSESAAVGGAHHNVQGAFATVIGGDYNEVTSTANNAVVMAGVRGKAHLRGQRVMAGGRFSATGDAQVSELVLRIATTNATPTNLTIHSTHNIVIPADTAWHCWIEIMARKSGGGDHAAFVRRCVIERTVNATALVGSVQTIGTDIASGGAGAWAVAITADDTNEALQVQVTGAAATNIRWVAWVRMVEVGYA